jgi:PAS domain S-box-containing protein
MEMFGYGSREEFAQTNIRDLYEPPEQRGVFIARIEREGYVKEQPIRLRRNDGRILDTLVTAVPLRNPDGSLKAFIGTIRDVTEQKKKEEQIR